MDTKAIREALNKATPGKWILSPGDCIDEPAAVFIILNDEINTQTIADNLLGVDAHLIANAPEWLRQLLDEVERLKQKSLQHEKARKELADTIVSKLKEISRLKAENERLKECPNCGGLGYAVLSNDPYMTTPCECVISAQVMEEYPKLKREIEHLNAENERLQKENSLISKFAEKDLRDWREHYEIKIDHLKEQMNIEKLGHDEALDLLNKTKSQLNDILADKAVLIEALNWYSDRQHYLFGHPDTDAHLDDGNRARIALKQINP